MKRILSSKLSINLQPKNTESKIWFAIPLIPKGPFPLAYKTTILGKKVLEKQSMFPLVAKRICQSYMADGSSVIWNYDNPFFLIQSLLGSAMRALGTKAFLYSLLMLM